MIDEARLICKPFFIELALPLLHAHRWQRLLQTAWDVARWHGWITKGEEVTGTEFRANANTGLAKANMIASRKWRVTAGMQKSGVGFP